MDQRLGKIEHVCRALADSTRLRILGLLASGETCVCHIHGSLGIPQPTASRHLAYLKRAGLVADRRDGLWVHYRIADSDDPVVATMLQGVRHALEHVKTTTEDRKKLARATGQKIIPVQALDDAPCCGGFTR